MDKPPGSGKKLEGILKETLFEISRGKNDPFHRVVADVVEEITLPEERIRNKKENSNDESR